MKTRNGYILCMLAVVLLALAFTSIPIEAAEQMTFKTLQEDTSKFANPERGWYAPRYTNSVGSFSTLKNNFGTLALLECYLYDFRNGDISSQKLTEIRNAFNTCRSNNLSVMFRAGYTFVESGQPRERSAFEPTSINTILRHVEQLKPIFMDNADILYAVQAGFFGPWGEWHESIYSTRQWGDWIHRDNTSKLVNALLAAVPESAYIMLRTPNYVRTLKSFQPSTDLARIGLHDDGLFNGVDNCGTFMRTDNDGVSNNGTYASSAADRTKELNWIDNHCRITPFAAESNSSRSYTNTNDTVKELGQLHMQSLNIEYHTGLINSWKSATYNNENLYDYITRKLGYSFVIRRIGFNNSIGRGGYVHIQFDVENNGFGNLLKAKDFKVFITKGNTVYSADVKINAREWFKEEGLLTNDIYLSVPVNIEAGTWQVNFRLSSAYPSLKDKPEYSVRFANKDVWKSANGYNYVGDIVISNSIVGNNTDFKEIPGPDTPPVTNKYTVTVIDSYATPNGAGDYEAGETVPIKAGDRSGYTFNGWTTSTSGVSFANANEKETTFIMPAGSVTVTANWAPTVKKYKVTVIGSYATPNGAGEYEAGETVRIAAGDRVEYTYIGWTTSTPGVSFANANDNVTTFIMPARDVTVTANWGRYTLTYNRNGGSGTTPSSQQGGVVTVRGQGSMTRSGYDFAGWKTQSNGDAADYQPGVDIELRANMTLYAHWTPVKYTVTVNGSYASPNGAGSYAAGETVEILAGSRANYNFDGWTTSTNNVSFANANAKETTFTMPARNVTVTANWSRTITITVFTLTYNANNGSGTKPANQSDGTVIVSGQHGLYRSNYVFTGWGTSSNGGTIYQPGQSITLTSNITLYAQWKSIRTITYNINSGSGTVHPVQHVIDGNSVVLSGQHGMYRSGYTFEGWNTSSSGNGTSYNAGKIIQPSGNLTLYAKWQRI